MTASSEAQDMQPERGPVDETEKLLKAIFGSSGVSAASATTGGTPTAIEGRFSSVESRFGQVETRLSTVEARLGQVDKRLSAVEARVGQLDSRLAVVETKLGNVQSGQARVEAAILRLQENARTDFRLMFGAQIATSLGLAGMMAKGFHWV